MQTYEFYIKAANYFFRKGNYKLFNQFYLAIKKIQTEEVAQ